MLWKPGNAHRREVLLFTFFQVCISEIAEEIIRPRQAKKPIDYKAVASGNANDSISKYNGFKVPDSLVGFIGPMFSCDVCSAQFKDGSRYIRHRYNIHGIKMTIGSDQQLKSDHNSKDNVGVIGSKVSNNTAYVQFILTDKYFGNY